MLIGQGHLNIKVRQLWAKNKYLDPRTIMCESKQRLV